MNENGFRIVNYSCSDNGMSLETLRGCGVTLLSHISWTPDMDEMKRSLAEAHALGIRVIPYVSVEKAWFLDTPERLERFNRHNPAGSLPFYRAVDPSEHPEWILIDELGRPKPRYGSYFKNDAGDWEVRWGVWEAHGQRYENPNNPNPWSWYMCSGAEGFLDAIGRGVRALMDMGYDGVFVDNVYTKRLGFLCQGEALGKHRHDPPGHNTDRTYFETTARIYRAVKSYGADRIVLLNSGNEAVYEPFRDGSMLESYVVTSGAKERRHDWERILSWAEQFRDEPKRGRCVTALSYLGTKERPDKEDCFYAYACAQLSAFKWTGSLCPRPDFVRLLHRAQLVTPEGDLTERAGLWFRLYDRGVAVVNPDPTRQVEAWLPLPAGAAVPVELHTGRRLAARGGEALVRVPPASGRVVVDLKEALRNYLTECAVNLRQAGEGLEGFPDRALLPPPPSWGTGWQSASQGAVRAAGLLERFVVQPGPVEEIDGARLDALLADVLSWCEAAGVADDPHLRLLHAADEAARRAAGLLTGVELAFTEDCPKVGSRAGVGLVLTNHGDASCIVSGLGALLPEGWEATLPRVDPAWRVEAGGQVVFSLQVRIPAGTERLPNLLLMRVSAACRREDGRVVPCGASCFAEAVDIPSTAERPKGVGGENAMPG